MRNTVRNVRMVWFVDRAILLFETVNLHLSTISYKASHCFYTARKCVNISKSKDLAVMSVTHEVPALYCFHRTAGEGKLQWK